MRDASRKHASKNAEECDFSTISSAGSLDDDQDTAEKENQRNQKTRDSITHSSSMNGKTSNSANSDVIDLCDSE